MGLVFTTVNTKWVTDWLSESREKMSACSRRQLEKVCLDLRILLWRMFLGDGGACLCAL